MLGQCIFNQFVCSSYWYTRMLCVDHNFICLWDKVCCFVVCRVGCRVLNVGARSDAMRIAVAVKRFVYRLFHHDAMNSQCTHFQLTYPLVRIVQGKTLRGSVQSPNKWLVPTTVCTSNRYQEYLQAGCPFKRNIAGLSFPNMFSRGRTQQNFPHTDVYYSNSV